MAGYCAAQAMPEEYIYAQFVSGQTGDGQPCVLINVYLGNSEWCASVHGRSQAIYLWLLRGGGGRGKEYTGTEQTVNGLTLE